MYQLFEVAGIELEYMIVDSDSLNVKPISDKLLFSKSDKKSDVFNGEIDWSNELVSHVIEIKTHKPASRLNGLHESFHKNIVEINEFLQKENARLLPTGAHPLMDPHKETVIWPHEYNEIYALYDSIFGCTGHGWSNLQSMHINLPFDGDEQFGKLHAAIRLLLPLIPSLCASTPVIDGKITGYADTRLEYYRKNQAKIPSIGGKVIPEQVFTKKDYYENIFNPIVRDIKPYDKDGVLEYHFLNSRGAIARFDRGAIEIRLIDLQEAPVADLAIAEFFIAILKNLAEGVWSETAVQQTIAVDELSPVFLSAIKEGDGLKIDDASYLSCFGIKEKEVRSVDLWQKLLEEVAISATSKDVIRNILKHGTLAKRITERLKADASESSIVTVYKDLAQSLALNRLYL